MTIINRQNLKRSDKRHVKMGRLIFADPPTVRSIQKIQAAV